MQYLTEQPFNVQIKYEYPPKILYTTVKWEKFPLSTVHIIEAITKQPEVMYLLVIINHKK